MNYAELQQAILDDTHKSQYVGAPVQRFIAEGEALIGAHLESYNFLATLTDENRVVAGEAAYTLPSKLTHLRYVMIAGLPLDKVDETFANLYKTASQSSMYVQRVGQIFVAANPAAGTVINIDYMGMPQPLATVNTNTLLDDAQQLYIDAAAHYVYKRAQDYESAELALQSVVSMCAQLNRKVKKLLGGAQSAPAYNVQFRSSY